MSIYVNVLVILLLIKYSLNHWPNIEQAKIQKIFLVISSIILALFTGLRDKYTGADTIAYGTVFLRLRKYNDFWKAVEMRAKNGEYGYGFWNRFWGGITGNVNVYFTVTAAVFAVCLAIYIYKNSQNPFFSMILYYTVGMFSFQLTGMRQAMAMAILLISIEFIKKYSKNVLVGVKLEKDGQYLYVSSMYDIQDSKISRRLYSGRIKNANIDNDENK